MYQYFGEKQILLVFLILRGFSSLLWCATILFKCLLIWFKRFARKTEREKNRVVLAISHIQNLKLQLVYKTSQTVIIPSTFLFKNKFIILNTCSIITKLKKKPKMTEIDPNRSPKNIIKSNDYCFRTRKNRCNCVQLSLFFPHMLCF